MQLITLKKKLSNKFCVINYGAYDKCSIVYDSEVLRVAVCPDMPGFMAKRRIRRYSSGYLTFDKLGLAYNLAVPLEKGLFIRDIADVAVKYGNVFGIDYSNCELAVYGSIDDSLLNIFSRMFSMVWLYGSSAGDYHNTFEVKTGAVVKTAVALYADASYDIPSSETVFNITDRKIRAINNIEVCAEGMDYISSTYRNEIVMLLDLPYDIISFIK